MTVAADVVQVQPAPVTAPLMVSPGGSIVSVTVTVPDVGPSPTLPTVIVYVLGSPGASAGACDLPIVRSGTFTLVVAGAVVTVLGNAGRRGPEREVRRVLDRAPERQARRGDRDLEAHRRARARSERAARRRRRPRAEAHHHSAAGELAEIVTAASLTGAPLRRMLPGHEDRPAPGRGR